MISIHVPREGHDFRIRAERKSIHRISIHVPREGHDSLQSGLSIDQSNFNPRAPRGARPSPPIPGRRDIKLFQSTCPARGTTKYGMDSSTAFAISIHVPREGHDSFQLGSRMMPSYFNPRAPRGARQLLRLSRRNRQPISIHVPREGHDDNINLGIAQTQISIHVPREGHDRRRQRATSVD